ncbi:MAG: anti-sigma factor domain-containing protein [Leptolyngbyaceae cyanobacterium]
MASERKLDELAADYVAGNLSETEADALDRLVSEHPELQAEINRMEKTVSLVLNELPMIDPPAHLRTAILAQAEKSTVQPQPRLSWPLVLGTIATGATVLSLTLGLSNYRLRLANQQLQQELTAAMPAQQAQLILQQPTTRFYDFEGTNLATDAFGSMIVDTDGLKAAIAFQNLPPLPADQTYALWVRHGGQYVPCGDFQTEQTGAVFATLPMPPVYQSRPWVTDVIVTVESIQLPAQPTGSIVAKTI